VSHKIIMSGLCHNSMEIILRNLTKKDKYTLFNQCNFTEEEYEIMRLSFIENLLPQAVATRLSMHKSTMYNRRSDALQKLVSMGIASVFL